MSLPTTITSDDAIADLDPIRREAYEWIARFMGGGMTSADLEAVKAWYRLSAAHEAAYGEARRVWQALGPVAGDAVGRLAGARQMSHTAPRSPVDRLSSPGRRVLIGGAIAASAAYLLVRPPLNLWPSYAELMADLHTGAGERRQVTLADRASLDLNTRTSIAVRSQTADATQIELLSGETSISTGPTALPLTVIAAGGRITATEADFNLRCDGAEVSITCLRGNLTVERDGSMTFLSARQQVGYDDRAMGAIVTIDPDIVTAWQHGVLIFDSAPVAQVIAEINRYRSGRIVLMNAEIGRRLLNARVRTSETDKIIVQIVHIFGVKARELPGGIVFLT
jgi:transmembrane sensor